MKSRRYQIFFLGATLWLCPTVCFAISSTEQVASPHCPVSQEEARLNCWPEGVLDLVNDVTRTNGWRPWFSECPSDIVHYNFCLEKRKELKRILAKFLAIKNDSLRILLVAAKESEPENEVAATFCIGNQQMIDEWFERIEKDDSGARIFGVNRMEKPPTACPPTLTLLVDDKLVKLKRLHLPGAVEVKAGVSDSHRKEQKDNRAIEAIDAFVSAHERQRGVQHRP